MIDLHKLRESIDRAATEAVQKHEFELQQSLRDALAHSIAGLKKTIVSQVLAELEPDLATPQGGAPTDLLNAAAASIQDANTQGDILSALLGGAEKFSERCGLLVVRGGQASGYNARGLDAEAFRQVKVDVGGGLAERAIRTRGPVAGTVGEFDANFVMQFGAPADGNVILLPLVVRDRVAALLYADGGVQGTAGLDASGIEVLVRTTDLWLEVISARKAAERGDVSAGLESGSFRAEGAGQAAPTAYESAVSEIPAGEVAAMAAETVQEMAIPQPAEAAAEVAAAAAIVAAASETHEAPAAELDEVHKKAKRFAKLLVDEIKLYNQAKVAEGRTHKDIYDRLRDDIDKSRGAYVKRYGDTVTDADYFSSELVRILAEGDASAMGGSFAK
jgi:hypothetical protein